MFVDVKTRAKSSYKLLHTLFCRYRHIVTCSTPETCDAKPSTIVISGNRLPYQSIQEQQERYAVLDGRLEPKLIERSLERVSRLAKHYKGQTDVKRAWSEGDEALLLQAARQSIVQVGSIESLDISQKLCLVDASNAVGGAASMMMASPLVGLASALEYKGFSVTTLLYDRNHLAETKHSILNQLVHFDVTLFVSTSRTRLQEDEKGLALEVARTAKRFIHLALWNPYSVQDLPTPALLSFGFRPESIRAVADVLAGGEATGVLPTTLTLLE